MTTTEERLIDIHGDVKTLIADSANVKKEVGEVKAWLVAHQKTDNTAFEKVHTRINGVYKYAAAISVVAAGVGYAAGKFI